MSVTRFCNPSSNPPLQPTRAQIQEDTYVLLLLLLCAFVSAVHYICAEAVSKRGLHSRSSVFLRRLTMDAGEHP